jgi:ABC-type polysaccharide/polyol phosphate transport system ATPase subunit
MTHVRLTDVNVGIPIYDVPSLRLIRRPSFKHAKVGTDTASRSGGALVMHVLKNLNLDLAEGDRVCVIGHNGAGKTTLLRVVSRIYPTVSGTVDVMGTVLALLGNSMAMNMDATGYENIQLMASLYDWPRERYQRDVRDIEEFTELGEYLALPIRVYSAGMRARLAFALATTEAPDILLIDEGIGAGDAHFQEKVQQRVTQFVSRARILLLASHSAPMCQAMCSKALLLSKGESIFYGDVKEAFQTYAKL